MITTQAFNDNSACAYHFHFQIYPKSHTYYVPKLLSLHRILPTLNADLLIFLGLLDTMSSFCIYLFSVFQSGSSMLIRVQCACCILHILYIIRIPPNKDYHHEPGSIYSMIQYKVHTREYLLKRVFPTLFFGWYCMVFCIHINNFSYFLKNQKNLVSMVSQP